MAFHFGTLGAGATIAVVLAVVMSDLFDNVGTSVSVARNAGMLDDQGRLPRIKTALAIDGFDLRWDNASPLATFATIIVMPVTYSIANGVGVGIILHTCTELLNRRRSARC